MGSEGKETASDEREMVNGMVERRETASGVSDEYG